MDEINPLSKFLSPLISFICGKDFISVPGNVCGTIWGSFPVLGSFAVQFGDHLRYWDHLRAGIICGAVRITGPDPDHPKECNLDLFNTSFDLRTSSTLISNASVQFQKKIRKSSRCRSRSPKYAELGYFTLLLCRERPRNVERFIPH